MGKVGEHYKIHKGEDLLLSGDGIFFTLQGEGPSIGVPAIFIRLHFCNLHCVFSGGQICDASYTWDVKDPRFHTEGVHKSFSEILSELHKYECNRIVITGGEPLLQQASLIKLFSLLRTQYVVEIETNGTIMPDYRLLHYQVQWNCSPKLSNSGNRKDSINAEAIRAIQHSKNNNTNFKFVVTSLEDLEEVRLFTEEHNIISDNVIIMPEGVTQEILLDRMKVLADPVRDLGYRLTPRLQVLIWGNQRAK